MITDIPIIFRNVKGAPLTAAEVDQNFSNLRSAILALSQQTTQRVVIGNEPPAGERDGVIWIPPDYRAIYVWDSVNGKWVRMTEPTLYAVATSAGNAYEITIAGDYADIAALTGKIIAFKASGADNTGASTLKVNAFTPQAIKKDGTVDIAGGQIKTGRIYLVIYDGTNFQILNPTQISAAGPVFHVTDTFDIPDVGTSVTVPHALGKRPQILRGIVVCVDGPFSGFELGDEIDAFSFTADEDNGHEDAAAFTISSDVNQFVVGIRKCDNGIQYVPKDGANADSAVSLATFKTKFKMKLAAIVFP